MKNKFQNLRTACKDGVQNVIYIAVLLWFLFLAAAELVIFPVRCLTALLRDCCTKNKKMPKEEKERIFSRDG